MKSKLCLAGIFLSGVLLLSGCTLLPSPGEVIKAPQQAGAQENEDLKLKQTVQNLLPAGAKLVEPTYPAGAKAIQKGDLDGDGKDEVVATYSVGSNPAQLKVSVFKEKEIWNYDGQGYSLDWFSISDITGDKKPELLLGWTVGASAGNGLDIFSWNNNTMQRLAVLGYHKLEVEDMPGSKGTDGKAEIALWQKDTGDAYNIEVMRWQDNTLVPAEDVYPYYFKKAAEFYSQKVKEMPEAAFYWYYLADAQVKGDLPEEALQSIQTGINLKKSYPENYKWDLVKGEAYNKLGKYQQAITETQKAITTLDSSSAAFEREYLGKAYLQMAHSYIGLKDAAKARRAIESSLGITRSIYQGTDQLKSKLLPAEQLLQQLQ